MSFEFIKKLPTPQEIREKYPLSEELAAIKKARDEEIRKVFTGESDKFLVIIGPCSADNEEAVLDYAGRLAKVNEKVGDKLILIPRIYTNKPRTTGEGYKGMMHQPDPEKNRTCWQDCWQSVKCIFMQSSRPVLPQQMKCCTRKTTDTYLICFLM